MRTGRLITALLAGLAIPASALADPDNRVEVTPVAPVAKWSGGPFTTPTANPLLGSPVYDNSCENPAHPCHQTLVHVGGPGRYLYVDMTPSAGDQNDLDLFVYASNEKGERGKEVASSQNGYDSSEYSTVRDPAGYYLVAIVAYSGVEATFDATATLVQRPVTPVPAGAAPPAPAASAPAAFSAGLRVRGQRSGVARRRGVQATVRCSAACSGRLVLRAGKQTLGRVMVSHAGSLRVRPRRSWRRLSRSLRITLSGTLVGPGGARKFVRATFRLR